MCVSYCLFLHVDAVNSAADTTLYVIFTMPSEFDFMCIVCSLQARLLMRGAINCKIVQPWAEQGEVVHACTVQLACC